ncbi:MAG: hypothetical protein U1E95_00410 [Rubrivivax sp.]|nr:hypothetical protein [Pseudomonadota bacterium]
MSKRRSPTAVRLARDTLQLSIAAPQVVAHRVGRMLRAGPRPTAADRREFHTMSAEKVRAFWQSWAAMTTTAWQMQQQLWSSTGSAAWAWPPAPHRTAALPPDAALRVLAAGLKPVHARAVANARRLGGRRSPGRRR